MASGYIAGGSLAGVVVAFYASKDKAQAAADSINAGAAGDDWTDAVVVGVAS